MPFLANLNGSGTAMIDYDCSNLDVNLILTSFTLSTLGTSLKDENYITFIYINMGIYAITVIILLCIKELRVKLSSRMLIILCANEIVDGILTIHSTYSVLLPYNFWVMIFNINANFNLVWLSIISYDYLMVLW